MQVYKSFTPVVSVIMPTFNRESYLRRSIDSVVNQSVDSWELLIVDDGSTDRSFGVVNEYIMNYENIRYLKHANRKTPISTNAGLLATCGEFVTFLGSDDRFKPDHLKLRIEFMKQNPDIDFIHGGVEIIGYPFVKDKNDLTKRIHLSKCVIDGTFWGKRKVFFDLDGFKDLRYSDGSEFFERVEKKYKIAKVDFPTYVYYRDTPDSICSTIE
jgi:glycosyltransferase involved in cell wall biosynthesis